MQLVLCCRIKTKPLDDKQIDKVMKKLINAFERDLKAQIRS
jgi:hypothetical protein